MALAGRDFRDGQRFRNLISNAAFQIAQPTGASDQHEANGQTSE
jgi:hypothetical protein